jgi:predicted RNase H-like HicB family nuclease
MELVFEVREAEEGGFIARALGYSIFTEAETWDELRHNVREVADLHFEDEGERPKFIQLHSVAE